MDGLSAPSPEGFTGDFFTLFWEIIEHDVCLDVQSVFVSGCIKPSLNSSNMVLLPKTSIALVIG